MATNLRNENIFLNITLTQSCNLACSYCYENHKSKKVISFEDAKNILDKHLTNLSDDAYIEVDLFGGEPFVAFDRVKEIVEYAEDKKYTDHCFFCLVTNGTLVHGKIKEWLLENRNHVTCALSLDGSRESHNINRSNSFDMIDLDFFAQHYYQNPIKMTISSQTLPHLCENVIFCHTKGFEVSCNLAYGIDWSNENNVSILEEQLMKLINFYLEHPEIKICSLLGAPLEKVGNEENVDTYRQCGAGLNMVSYDIDGIAYPCQFFMPLSVGENKAIKMGEINFQDLLPRSALDGECQKCVAAAICHICYGANYSATGDIYKKDLNWCKLQKIIFKSTSYLRAKQWELGQLKSKPDEIYYTLKGIKEIQEKL